MTVQLALEREVARELYWSIPVDTGALLESLRKRLIAATNAVDNISFGEDDPTVQDRERQLLIDRAARQLDDAHDALDALIKLADINTCELRAALNRALYH